MNTIVRTLLRGHVDNADIHLSVVTDEGGRELLQIIVDDEGEEVIAVTREQLETLRDCLHAKLVEEWIEGQR